MFIQNQCALMKRQTTKTSIKNEKMDKLCECYEFWNKRPDSP